MTIERFVETEVGAKFKDVLKGCNDKWEVEYWDNMNDYATCLALNHWSNEDIADEIDYIYEVCYKANPDDYDFVIVIN